MQASRALIDELEQQVRVIERLWSAEPPARLRRPLCRDLGELEGRVRHLLLRARCGAAGDDLWVETLACGRLLERLRAQWHRDPLAA